MARYVALLRGVNLGATRRVPMGPLREALAEAGFADVRTLLQSGNVGLTTTRTAKEARAGVEAVIGDRFGVATDAVLRTAAQLEAIVAAHPLRDVATDPKRLQVVFLDARPRAAAVRELEAADVAPEQIVVAGREIFVWHANGIQKSPAAKLLDKADVGATATARNWNTVEKLLDLAR